MGKIEHKRAILITGTVIPNSNYVSHADPEKRLKEYYEALLFNSGVLSNDDIYFLENSDYDFSTDEKFQKLFKEKNITLVKFPKSQKYEQGKGYQEFEMLDKTMIQLGEKYKSFIKLTGRYKVLNIEELTGIECENIVIDCHKKPAVAQTNVFYCTFDFYKNNLMGLFKESDDSQLMFIEKIVYKKLMLPGVIEKIKMFPKNPIVKGISGSYGSSLNRNKTKMKLRNIERKLLNVLGAKQFLVEY